MKSLPIGIQDFAKLRGDNYIYVDKTSFIPSLIENYSYAFISRPRRFGKSLFISTLEEFFKGNRELFKGLVLYDYAGWNSYPVIRLDFSTTDNSSPSVLEDSISEKIVTIAGEYGVSIDTSIKSLYLANLVELLYGKFNKRVVILIDEYDKPITDHFNDQEKADANRDLLRNLYSPLKGLDGIIRFAFFTGVSKFA